MSNATDMAKQEKTPKKKYRLWGSSSKKIETFCKVFAAHLRGSKSHNSIIGLRHFLSERWGLAEKRQIEGFLQLLVRNHVRVEYLLRIRGFECKFGRQIGVGQKGIRDLEELERKMAEMNKPEPPPKRFTVDDLPENIRRFFKGETGHLSDHQATQPPANPRQ